MKNWITIIIIIILAIVLSFFIYRDTSSTKKIDLLNHKADSLNIKIKSLNAEIKNNQVLYFQVKNNIAKIEDSLNMLKHENIILSGKYQKISGNVRHLTDDELTNEFSKHIIP
jgi:outer membrane murein-binding lipoprotein Lpp